MDIDVKRPPRIVCFSSSQIKTKLSPSETNRERTTIVNIKIKTHRIIHMKCLFMAIDGGDVYGNDDGINRCRLC